MDSNKFTIFDLVTLTTSDCNSSPWLRSTQSLLTNGSNHPDRHQRTARCHGALSPSVPLDTGLDRIPLYSISVIVVSDAPAEE
jgi:hypothetical protein